MNVHLVIKVFRVRIALQVSIGIQMGHTVVIVSHATVMDMPTPVTAIRVFVRIVNIIQQETIVTCVSPDIMAMQPVAIQTIV